MSVCVCVSKKARKERLQKINQQLLECVGCATIQIHSRFSQDICAPAQSAVRKHLTTARHAALQRVRFFQFFSFLNETSSSIMQPFTEQAVSQPRALVRSLHKH